MWFYAVHFLVCQPETICDFFCCCYCKFYFLIVSELIVCFVWINIKCIWKHYTFPNTRHLMRSPLSPQQLHKQRLCSSRQCQVSWRVDGAPVMTDKPGRWKADWADVTARSWGSSDSWKSTIIIRFCNFMSPSDRLTVDKICVSSEIQRYKKKLWWSFYFNQYQFPTS